MTLTGNYYHFGFYLSTLWRTLNGRCLQMTSSNVVLCTKIVLSWMYWSFTAICFQGSNYNEATMVEIMVWGRKGDKILSVPMMTKFTDAYKRHSVSVNRGIFSHIGMMYHVDIWGLIEINITLSMQCRFSHYHDRVPRARARALVWWKWYCIFLFLWYC